MHTAHDGDSMMWDLRCPVPVETMRKSQIQITLGSFNNIEYSIGLLARLIGLEGRCIVSKHRRTMSGGSDQWVRKYSLTAAQLPANILDC